MRVYPTRPSEGLLSSLLCPEAGFRIPPAAHPKSQWLFDATGRVVREVKASGGEVDHRYGPGLVEMIDRSNAALPRIVTKRLDGLGRIVAVERPIQGRIASARYSYDALNRLIRTTSPDGGITRMAFDLLGRVLMEQSPDSGRRVMVVDAAGNLVSRTDATGKTITYRFDALDRMLESREQGSTDPQVSFTYLNQGDSIPTDGLQNRFGRVFRVRDRIGEVSYAYDPAGRVTQTRRTIAALADRELVTDATYDALGRQTRVTLPAPMAGGPRVSVDYRYNARGLPLSCPGYVRSVDYDVQGHVTRQVLQNNVDSRVDYGALTGLPTRLQILAPDNSLLRDQTFTFDAAACLLRIDSPLPLEAGSFQYDEFDRLVRASYDSGETFEYDYSDGANITRIRERGNLTYHPGQSAVRNAGSDSYDYDAAGQLRQAPYGSLQWDAFGHLAKITLSDQRTIDCLYDFNGQLALRISSDGKQTIFPDANVEFHDGQPLVWISFGGRRIFALSGATGLFLHSDLLGTPTLFTTPEGSVARRLAFGPYGTLRSDSAAGSLDGLRFAGGIGDPDTGLICFGLRYYDPRIGRFLSADCVAPGVFLLDGWNRYVYAHNNPLRYADPLGLLSIGDIFAIIGIVIVVAALVVAGIFTGGATWAVAGVVINVSGLLFATAIGVAGGAILGGIAAYEAGR